MKQPVFILLFIATVDRIVLQGIYPILPVMVADLGVSAKNTGLFMVITYIAIAAGSMLTPKILKYYASVNRLSVVIALLTALALLGMGVQKTYTVFLLATAAYWFLSGVQINIYSIIMSYISPVQSIGRNYGLLANTTLTGSVIGSFMIGPVIHNLGGFYSFLIFGIVTVVTRLAMLLTNYDFVYAQHKYTGPFTIKAKLWILLLTLNTGIMLSFIGRFNLSLIMKQGHYSINDISFIFGMGSLIAFPLPYFLGVLSQRLAGKFLLAFTLLCVSLSMFVLYRGQSYPSFLWVSFLICIMTYCSRGVTQKVIYDIYPLKQQTHAQSLISSSNWIAGILGFLLVSFTSGIFPLEQVSLLGGILGLVSVVVLMFF